MRQHRRWEQCPSGSPAEDEQTQGSRERAELRLVYVLNHFYILTTGILLTNSISVSCDDFGA